MKAVAGMPTPTPGEVGRVVQIDTKTGKRLLLLFRKVQDLNTGTNTASDAIFRSRDKELTYMRVWPKKGLDFSGGTIGFNPDTKQTILAATVNSWKHEEFGYGGAIAFMLSKHGIKPLDADIFVTKANEKWPPAHTYYSGLLSEHILFVGLPEFYNQVIIEHSQLPEGTDERTISVKKAPSKGGTNMIVSKENIMAGYDFSNALWVWFEDTGEFYSSSWPSVYFSKAVSTDGKSICITKSNAKNNNPIVSLLIIDLQTERFIEADILGLNPAMPPKPLLSFSPTPFWVRGVFNYTPNSTRAIIPTGNNIYIEFHNGKVRLFQDSKGGAYFAQSVSGHLSDRGQAMTLPANGKGIAIYDLTKETMLKFPTGNSMFTAFTAQGKYLLAHDGEKLYVFDPNKETLLEYSLSPTPTASAVGHEWLEQDIQSFLQFAQPGAPYEIIEYGDTTALIIGEGITTSIATGNTAYGALKTLNGTAFMYWTVDLGEELIHITDRTINNILHPSGIFEEIFTNPVEHYPTDERELTVIEIDNVDVSEHELTDIPTSTGDPPSRTTYNSLETVDIPIKRIETWPFVWY